MEQKESASLKSPSTVVAKASSEVFPSSTSFICTSNSIVMTFSSEQFQFGTQKCSAIGPKKAQLQSFESGGRNMSWSVYTRYPSWTSETATEYRRTMARMFFLRIRMIRMDVHPTMPSLSKLPLGSRRGQWPTMTWKPTCAFPPCWLDGSGILR